MTKLEKVLYTAKTHTTGGRDGWASRSDDGRLQVTLSGLAHRAVAPTRNNCLRRVGQPAFFRRSPDRKQKEDNATCEMAVDAEVDLGTIHGGVGLAARLNVSLPDMDQETAQSLVDAASHVCPYSTGHKRQHRGEVQPHGNTACLKLERSNGIKQHSATEVARLTSTKFRQRCCAIGRSRITARTS